MSFKDIVNKFKKVIVNICKGKFIVEMHLDRCFPHIIVLFLLSLTSMFMSYKAEQTMLQRERNKSEIEMLRIRRSQIAVKVASMDRLTTVDSKLKAMGSKLEAPQKPATIVKD